MSESWIGADEKIADLEEELAKCKKRTAWQHCDKHGEIDGNRAWGCPDCIDELRNSNKKIRDALLELIDRIDEVQHLESKLFKAREVLKDNG
jgi:hypothetical protein